MSGYLQSLCACQVLALVLLSSGCERKRPAGDRPASSAGPNVLLVTLDTTRADRLGCYGYANGATPTLDALAAKGTLFQHAYAQAPLTMPSHCSIMSGKYPREHGVRINGREALSPDNDTLASLFKQHGYRTGAFIGSLVLDPSFGLDHGFETYDADMGAAPRNVDILEVERRADAVTDRALKWLGSNEGRPFFCWIHYYDPHLPYDPPAAFRKTPADPYDGEIAFVDSQFKRVVDWLAGANLTAKTLVVVVGDHGESLGEHGEQGHAIFLYDVTLHVPLIFSQPGAIAAGRQVATDVELIDIFPTILESMSWPEPTDVSARSLVPAFQGDLEPRACFAESLYVHGTYGWAEQRCIVTEKWKYVSSTKPELFDRQADPQEKENLAAARSDVARALQAELLEHHKSSTPGRSRQVEVTDEMRRSIEALGYLNAGNADETEEFLTAGAPDPKDLLDVVADVQKARVLLSGQRSAEAIPLLQRAAQRCPGSRLVRITLGQCLLEAGQVDAAVPELEAALRIDPRYSDALVSLGDAMLKLGKPDKAVDCFRSAIATRGRFPEAELRLAGALQQAGRPGEALAAYQRVIASSPGWADAHCAAGRSMLSQGRMAEAVSYLREAVRLKPDLGEALNYLGVALAQQGQVVEAKEVFNRATQIADSAGEAYFNLGVTAAKEGSAAEAAAFYERSIQIKPSSARTIETLAGMYVQQNRTADAIRVLRVGVAASPNELVLANTLAWLLATTPTDALRDGATAVTLAKHVAEMTMFQDPTTLCTLAAAYAETGDFTQAAQTAQRALDLAAAAQMNDFAAGLRAQLDSYKAGKPYRTPN